MGKILWTNTTDDKNFSYHADVALPLVFPGVFFLFFAVLGFLKVQYGGAVGGMLLLYLYACMVFGILFIHGVTGNRDYLVIYEDKVFIQIAGFSGGRYVIPRSKFRVDVFSYDEYKNEDVAACPPEIVLERPFKNKIYFIFRRNLTEPELKGQGRAIGAIRRVLVTERDMKRLINILNPKRLINLRTRLTMGYAFAKLNFGNELKELIEKILDVDFLPMAIECYGETKKASIAMTAMDDTLAALSLFRMKKEAALFMEYCITGRIKRYMQREEIIKIFRRWNPSMGTFSDDSMDIRWLVGFVLLGLMVVSATFGAVSLMASAVIFIAMLMIGAKQMFINYNGITGQTKSSFFRGLTLGVLIDGILGYVHAVIPFIAVQFFGPEAAIPTTYLLIYLVVSYLFTALAVYDNIGMTGYVEFRKLVNAWLKFLEERGKAEMKYEEVSV